VYQIHSGAGRNRIGVKNPVQPETNLTLPNILTALRIVMALVAAVCFATRTAEIFAVVLCAVATLLDAFDGWYARKFSQCTRLGEHLDPLADKLIMAVVYGVIAWKASSSVVWIVIGLIAIRELGMTLFRTYSFRRYKKFIPANVLGKAKMILQSTFGLFILGFSYIGGFDFNLAFVLVPLLLILVVSYYSAAVYLVGWRNAEVKPRNAGLAGTTDLPGRGGSFRGSKRAVAGE
jgi:CDP-diacylglycerol--glycerol-3-phosphate 3-phosphatidyltransferase